ncbi:hypothetical protein MASR1M59_17310 [Melaminivora sp.]
MKASRITLLPAAAAALMALLTLLPLPGQAQQVYRIVGPDGKVTFSDRPPDSSAQPSRSGAAAAPAVELPYALRQVVARYPVTLYSGNDCSPCQQARNLLTRRGVPFTERTVHSAEDIDALKRLAGEAALPFASIGTQQLKGFSEQEWTQYLDAAGYPAQSQLPPQYRRPAATPLVASSPKPTPAAPGREASTPANPRPQPAPQRNPSNPAGIIF